MMVPKYTVQLSLLEQGAGSASSEQMAMADAEETKTHSLVMDMDYVMMKRLQTEL